MQAREVKQSFEGIGHLVEDGILGDRLSFVPWLVMLSLLVKSFVLNHVLR